LDLLDEYERSFEEAQIEVVRVIRETLGLAPTARPLKTVHSVVAKLRRGAVELHQMQDIAGCRIVVDDIMVQEEVVDRLKQLPWDGCREVDRRRNPSHGYRAVHLIVRARGRRVEIQVRSRLQDLWAQLSEREADEFGIDVKYGAGPPDVRSRLDRLSLRVAEAEDLRVRLEAAQQYRHSSEEGEMEFRALETDIRRIEREWSELLAGFLAEPSS
jgi:ppGpp synthetase/RelA/SpoT-type nucleotidyltranferase